MPAFLALAPARTVPSMMSGAAFCVVMSFEVAIGENRGDGIGTSQLPAQSLQGALLVDRRCGHYAHAG